MTKSELIARLAARSARQMAADSRSVVEIVLEAIAATLANGDRVKIGGFGTFTICYRPPRTAKNPKTGAAVVVSGKTVSRFRAGKLLRETVATVANRRVPSQRYQLDDLLAQIPPGTRFEEFDVGPAVGREVL